MKRYLVLYLATALVMLPLDLIFLGFMARGFFNAQVGTLLGEVRLAPAVLFYLILRRRHRRVRNRGGRHNLAVGADAGRALGLVCYATFELTAMSLLRHWTWPVVIVDMTWGVVLTATAASIGSLLANWMLAKV